MRTWLLHTTLAIVILGFAPAAHADLNKDCGELLSNLQSCTPYKCAYNKMTLISKKNASMNYQIVGVSENNTCHYKINIDDKPLLNCKLSDKSKKIITEILTMQFDGSFQKEQEKLITAMKNKNIDNLDTLDPRFMSLSTKMRDIMISECNG
jgi:peroxiredoxin